MIRNFSIVLVILFGLSLIACAQKQHRQQTKKVVQGICGTVMEKRGNHMPSPDSPSPKDQPAEREILVFPLLNMSQVAMGDNGFINSVGGAKPVKTVMSDKDGTFCVSLPVGRYSIVVREPKGLYANLFDAKNNIFPVRVQKNRRTTVNVEISHQAVF